MNSCCWCTKVGASLVPHRKYCYICKENMFRECKRCKRPLDSKKYFEKDDTRCNACHKKYLKEKTCRIKKKEKIGVLLDKELTTQENNLSKQNVTPKSEDETEDYTFTNTTKHQQRKIKIPKDKRRKDQQHSKKISTNATTQTPHIKRPIVGYIILKPEKLKIY